MTTARAPHAVIIGGGIAGPVTAMALQRAGIGCVLYEAYPSTADTVGAFLGLAPNGLDALRALDLHELVRAQGFDTPAIRMSMARGRPLAQFTLARTDGVPAQTVSRAKLYQALRAEAERRGVRIEYGKRLTDAATDGESVRARFDDGTEARADLLIGADGLQSVTRRLIDPDAPNDVPGEVGVQHMIVGRRCFFGYIPLPNGEVWWFANPPQATELSRDELAGMTQQVWRAKLARLFAKDKTPAIKLVEATPEIFAGWNTYDFPSVPTWHRDRMIIIGDAAHATSPAAGQGASMAMEDGIELARCLRDLPDVPSAFSTFERLRRDRVERVVAQGKKNGEAKALSPWMQLLLPLVFRSKSGGDLRWMYDHHIDWDARVRGDTRAAMSHRRAVETAGGWEPPQCSPPAQASASRVVTGSPAVRAQHRP